MYRNYKKAFKSDTFRSDQVKKLDRMEKIFKVRLFLKLKFFNIYTAMFSEFLNRKAYLPFNKNYFYNL